MGEISKTHNETPVGTVKTEVSMGMKVIRADGTVEEHGEQFSKVVELTYDQAVDAFGQEAADKLFNGTTEREDDGSD
jgi:hypothetical protein